MKRLSLLSIIITVMIISSGTLNAQSTEELMSQGNMLLNNGAYDQAVSKFRKVIARDPGNFEAQFNLGFAYLNWGRNSNAVKELKKALGINPRSTDAWSNLAYAFENLGKSEQALNALYKAVESNPRNVQAKINLATVYANKGRLGHAIAQYKQVIQIDGTNLDAHLNLATCHVSKGNYKEAKHYLKAAIAINPNEADAYWELGNIAWEKDKNAEEAVKNYKKAITLKPNSQKNYKNLGLLLEELWKKNKDDSKKEEAIKVWNQSLVYLNDALEKENIHSRLEMLQRGESPTGKATPEELFGKGEEGNAELEQLRNEMKRGEESEETKKIQTQTYDVGSDLGGLGEEEEGSSAFDFDMQKAVDKKKEEKAEEKTEEETKEEE